MRKRLFKPFKSFQRSAPLKPFKSYEAELMPKMACLTAPSILSLVVKSALMRQILPENGVRWAEKIASPFFEIMTMTNL